MTANRIGPTPSFSASSALNRPPVIALHRATKRYGRVAALQGLDLEVNRGEIFGFLGPNGAGKTTTIRILMGLIKASSGTADVFGLDAWSGSVAIKRRVGFLPDVGDVYDALSGAEVLEFLGRLSGRDTTAKRKALAAKLGLSDADLARKMKGYSRGMKRKLGIIQALQHEPDLVIMDEPTEGLDPLVQEALFDLLLEQHRAGATIFMSSHKLSEVERLCQRVAILRAGTLVALDEMQRLRRRKVRRLEVEFKGAAPDALNLPGAKVLSKEGRRWTLAVQDDVNDVTKELARLDLADVTFEQPSLEDIFLDYYRPDGPVSGEET